ncbi:MAG: hypothetical protein KY456_13355 [Chloroflexi bacterium]|nr:hypothetical protein [Chloroflexota bacterium]
MNPVRTLVAAPLVLVLIVLMGAQSFLAPAIQDNAAFAAQEATPVR